jgi:Spy/CpxP family protein refolding chaperone
MQRCGKNAVLILAATLACAGSALAQGFGFGMMGGGGANMLRMPEVQTELKLTDDQKTKVNDMLQQLRQDRQGQFQGLRDLPPEEAQKKIAEWRADEEKRVNAILNADQQKRYHQLQLQQRGLTAVADKPVADELKLTDEQRGKVQTALDAQRQGMQQLFQDAGGNFNPQEMRPKFEALRKKTDDQIAAALTDDQKKQWKEMLGAPFTFPAPGPPGGRAGA